MKFISKLEKKIGKFAIPNLMRVLIACYIVGYVFQTTFPEFLNFLTLEPYYILKGQVWRLVSWVIVPEAGFNIFFTLIMLYFYYSIGTDLERTWGEFRFNLYIFGGIIFTDIAALILYFVIGGDASFAVSMAGLFSTYYINLSLFLAFAMTYPDHQILFMFVVPVKMKWMGLVYLILQFYFILTTDWIGRTAIIASLFNFILFYLMTRNYKKISPHEIKRKTEFKRQIREVTIPGAVRHRCAVCGRTDVDFPELEFRFCSKCDGNFEYCQDHLFTHEHVKKN